MENNRYGESAREGADHQNNWQNAEKRNSEGTEEAFDMRSAEANGYGVEDNYSAKHRDDEDNDTTEKGDVADNDDDEATASEWGDVDPQSSSSGNDPAAPGSAV